MMTSLSTLGSPTRGSEAGSVVAPRTSVTEASPATAPLRAYASGHPTSLTSPGTGYFFANATGGTPPYSWSWTETSGGQEVGSVSEPQNYSSPFYSAGIYVWTVNVTDAVGDYNMSSVVFTVAPGPLTVHDYLAFTTSWSLTDSAAVTVIGGEAPYNVTWSWGDGAMSYVSYPTNDLASHTYAQPGKYTVNMTVRDALGATASNVTFITIEGENATGGALTVQATASVTSGSAPLTVDFTGTASGGGPYVWSWSFGDGSSSNSQDPTHTYEAGGLYDAALEVRNSTGAYAQTSIWINVSGSSTGGGSGTASLVAEISAAPLSGSVPLTVSFNGSASGGTPPYTFQWEFGDGQGSTLQNPVHTYQGVGSFIAALQVSDQDGASSAEFVVVSVSDEGCGNCSPVPALSAPTTVVAGGTASFSATFAGATSGTYELLWSFGDGETATSTIDLQASSQATVQHTFERSGTYRLSLLVSGATGRPSGAVATVVVRSSSLTEAPPPESGLPAWLVPVALVGGLVAVILVAAVQVQRRRKEGGPRRSSERPSNARVLPPYSEYRGEYEASPDRAEGGPKGKFEAKGNGNDKDEVIGLV